jgi:hypothetical protein
VYSIEEILEATNIIYNKNLPSDTPITTEVVKNIDNKIPLSLSEINELNSALSTLTRQFIQSSTNLLTGKIFKYN